ncbi:MAG: hypothetical protein MMC33_005169 [Icmadophila ericetorum]|nr:hypothetical protein [Icmadophila ericetorum]
MITAIARFSLQVWWKVLAIGASSFILYRIFRRLKISASNRQKALALGCEPLQKPKKWNSTLGFDALYAYYKHHKNHTLLEFTQKGFFEECHVKTRPLSVLGAQVVIYTIEPENLKSILSLDFKSWTRAHGNAALPMKFLGEGIFTAEGEAWKRSRALVKPSFNKLQLVDLSIFANHFDDLLSVIPNDGVTEVDLQPLFFRFTLDVATQMLFGESTQSLVPERSKADVREFAETFDRCLELLGGGGSRGILGVLWPGKKYKEDVEFIYAFIDKYVEEASSSLPDSKDAEAATFLQSLLAEMPSSKTRTRHELLNILLAGRDTTASFLSNIFHTLSRRPDIWTRLQAEIAPLGGQPPTYDGLMGLKYLRAVLNESLRLFPVTPENSRQALCDTTLPLGGGPHESSPVFVRKGQIVAWSIWAMHRSKDLYGPDAEEFKPERWLDLDAAKEGSSEKTGGGAGAGKKGIRPGWGYLPFSGGPRVCIGQQFALVETSYVVVRLMQCFDRIESANAEEPWREKMTITCVGRGGCRVFLRSRGEL